jgi:hypothetical protein
MRDRRYWQSGHPERDDYARWVTEGFQALVAAEQAGASGTIEVQVRPYTRVRDGQTERVDGYVQKRRAGRGESRTGQSAATGSPAAAEPQPRPARPTLTIFFGGFGESLTGIVEGRAKPFERDNPTHTVLRFPHDDYDGPRQAAGAVSAGTRVVFIGYSWGGNTAARVAVALGESGRPIDLLVTVHPVSANATREFMEDVRRNTQRWVNVQAVGGGAFDPSNVIGRIGGRFGNLPDGIADRHIRAPVPHGAFGPMLSLPDATGVSAIREIVGR